MATVAFPAGETLDAAKMGALFSFSAAILAFAVAQKVRPAKEFGLGSATAVDFNRSGGGVLAQQFLAVARVLGVVIPQLHVVKNGMTAWNADDRAR